MSLISQLNHKNQTLLKFSDCRYYEGRTRNLGFSTESSSTNFSVLIGTLVEQGLRVKFLTWIKYISHLAFFITFDYQDSDTRNKIITAVMKQLNTSGNYPNET